MLEGILVPTVVYPVVDFGRGGIYLRDAFSSLLIGSRPWLWACSRLGGTLAALMLWSMMHRLNRVGGPCSGIYVIRAVCAHVPEIRMLFR